LPWPENQFYFLLSLAYFREFLLQCPAVEWYAHNDHSSEYLPVEYAPHCLFVKAKIHNNLTALSPGVETPGNPPPVKSFRLKSFRVIADSREAELAIQLNIRDILAGSIICAQDFG
jgi:hypothetical protein